MSRLKGLLYLIGGVQIVLGLLYLLSPEALLHWMGHSHIAADLAYPFAMLAARFLVYGALLLFAARDPARHRPLLVGMIGIQIIDLAAGLYYTLSGTVSLSLSGFPMFNAALFALLLWRWNASDARAA